ncbi:ankyrin repeat-containing domain protein, partial [Lasiosphaeris hirsuta]
GATALHCAVRAGSSELVDMLIKVGADLSVADSWGSLPLHLAKFCHDDTDLIKLCLQPGIDIDVREKGLGQTALAFAAKMNYVRGVEFLLERGSDLEATDDYGDIALFVSVLGRAPKSIEILLSRGAE